MSAEAGSGEAEAMMQRLARTSFRHPFITFGAWLVLVAVVTVGAGAVGAKFMTTSRMPGSDSQRAYDLLVKALPAATADTATIVVHDRRPLTSAPVAANLDAYLARVRTIVPGGRTATPAVSADGRTALIDVAMPPAGKLAKDGTPQWQHVADSLVAAAKVPRAHGLDVEFSGPWFTSGSVPANAELTGLVVALVVLLLLFGSFIAIGVTLVPALLAVGTTGSLIVILTHIMHTPDVTTNVATMIGLGVGIDYALFIVARFRRELVTRERDDAFAATMRTAGRAVLLAGSTVAVALLGMLLLRVDFINGLAVGSAVAVVTAVGAAFTLLPALMRWSSKSMTKRVRARGQRPARVGFWTGWSAGVVRRPVLALVIGATLLVLLTIPALSLRLASSDASSDPANSTTRRAYELTANSFGAGYLGPLVMAVDHATPQRVAQLRLDVRATHGVVYVSPPAFSKSGSVAAFTVMPSTGPQAAATEDLVTTLRHTTIPASHVSAYVGGQTAASIDFSQLMRSRLPLFIGGVLLCSFLMLLVVFRSIVIPLKAVLLNLASITAAFGAVVAVFQWGWFANALGFAGGAPVEPWIPMLLFAILFGLSMDYEVFLLSSIKENYDATQDTNTAIVRGMSSTARIITAAATIMIAVFASFITSDLRSVSLVGFGLAIAVLIDATVVRMLLVPSLMTLFGRANWWLPRFMAERLPHVSLEQATAQEPSAKDLVGVRA